MDEFSFVVEDIFSIQGRGTVARGKIQEGSIQKRDNVQTPRGKTGEVLAIEESRKLISSASKGAMVGLLLSKISAEELHRGDILKKV